MTRSVGFTRVLHSRGEGYMQDRAGQGSTAHLDVLVGASRGQSPLRSTLMVEVDAVDRVLVVPDNFRST